jgi:hypothetical protein
MSVKQFAVQMKSIIEDMQSKGIASIPCSNLIAYLNDVQNSLTEPTPIEIERYKVELQNQVEANKQQHEHSIEMFRSVIAAGQHATRSSFLLNGGASVAMLAFIGHLAEFETSNIAVFATCLLPFCFGVLAITVTSGLTYLTQFFYAGNKIKAGHVFNFSSVALGILSYLFFAWGMMKAYNAFIAYSG